MRRTPSPRRISLNAAAAADDRERRSSRSAAPPGLQSPGDRWTCVGSVAEAVPRIGARRRAASSWQSAGRRLVHFERAPQHSYVVRSVDPVDAAARSCRMSSPSSPRGPFAQADEAELLGTPRDRRHRRQEQRRRGHLRQDRGGASARDRGGDGRAPQACRRSIGRRL